MPSLRLEISINDLATDVHRVVDIPTTTTLYGLHLIIQAAFGWENEHLHSFTHGDTTYGLAEDSMSDTRSEKGVKVADLLKDNGDSLTYLYDFGDSWEHTVTLIDRDNRARKKATFVKGVGACPLENVGGTVGWEDILHDIEVAATGKGKFRNQETYDLMFGGEPADEVWEHFQGFGEEQLYWSTRDVKDVDVTEEPEEGELDSFNPAEGIGAILRTMIEDEGMDPADAINRYNSMVSAGRNKPALSDEITRLMPLATAYDNGHVEDMYHLLLDPPAVLELYNNASKEGVVGAIAGVVKDPLLYAMYKRYKEDNPTFSDKHAKIIGASLKELLDSFADAGNTERRLRKFVEPHMEDWAEGDPVELLTDMMAPALIEAFQLDTPMVDVRESPQISAFLSQSDEACGHQALEMFPAGHGEAFLWGVLAFLKTAYLDQSLNELARTTGTPKEDIIDAHMSAIAHTFIPLDDPDPLLATEIVLTLVAETATAYEMLAPWVVNPFRAEEKKVNPAVVSFARCALRNLDAMSLISRTFRSQDA